jgi:hypothetical protein
MTHPLLHIHQKTKIALEIAAKIASVKSLKSTIRVLAIEGRVGRVIPAKNVKTRLDEMNAASLFIFGRACRFIK